LKLEITSSTHPSFSPVFPDKGAGSVGQGKTLVTELCCLRVIRYRVSVMIRTLHFGKGHDEKPLPVEVGILRAGFQSQQSELQITSSTHPSFSRSSWIKEKEVSDKAKH